MRRCICGVAWFLAEIRGARVITGPSLRLDPHHFLTQSMRHRAGVHRGRRHHHHGRRVLGRRPATCLAEGRRGRVRTFSLGDGVGRLSAGVLLTRARARRWVNNAPDDVKPPSYMYDTTKRGYPDVTLNGHNYQVFPRPYGCLGMYVRMSPPPVRHLSSPISRPAYPHIGTSHGRPILNRLDRTCVHTQVFYPSKDKAITCPCKEGGVDGTSASAPAFAGLVTSHIL